MSTVHLCDYKDCVEPATFRIVAKPYSSPLFQVETGWLQVELGIDTCDAHYNITHAGTNGGGWWDDMPAPQRRVA